LGCDSIIITSLYVDICTLNTDESFAYNFRVSPNPAEKSLSIEFDRNFSGTMEIMDCYGRVLKAKSIRDSNKAEMDLSGLTGGIYMLRLNSKEYQAAQKIIVVN